MAKNCAFKSCTPQICLHTIFSNGMFRETVELPEYGKNGVAVII